MTPPRGARRVIPSAVTVVKMPNAQPRRLPPMVAAMSAGPVTESIAAPSPCTTRKPTSAGRLGAKEHSADPSTKVA